MNMKRVCLAVVVAALSLLPLVGQGQGGLIFDLQPVVPGVYAALARPQYKINCNAAVIVLDDGVMVVDTHSKPSAARALMAQIKTITDKPVKYVVNSHFHWDHYQGNEAYPAAWPQGLQIIASEATRESIEQRGIPRVRQQILAVPKEIEGLRANLAKAGDAAGRAKLQDDLSQAERYLGELKSMQVALPTVTFDRSLLLHGKSRSVQILWLGKAHTDGDVFVYLPNERFVATGDALHGWTPFMNDSYPYDWIRTLKAVEQLDFDYALGGHGGVFRGKAQFQMWEQYFADLMRESAAAYAEGASLNEAVARVSGLLVPKYSGRMPATFKDDVVANIQKAYRVVGGQVN
jgi:glyoxylase-like metal-dependent hydrolase (beta-lactamase superfamily II)